MQLLGVGMSNMFAPWEWISSEDGELPPEGVFHSASAGLLFAGRGRTTSEGELWTPRRLQMWEDIGGGVYTTNPPRQQEAEGEEQQQQAHLPAAAADEAGPAEDAAVAAAGAEAEPQAAPAAPLAQAEHPAAQPAAAGAGLLAAPLPPPAEAVPPVEAAAGLPTIAAALQGIVEPGTLEAQGMGPLPYLMQRHMLPGESRFARLCELSLSGGPQSKEELELGVVDEGTSAIQVKKLLEGNKWMQGAGALFGTLACSGAAAVGVGMLNRLLKNGPKSVLPSGWIAIYQQHGSGVFNLFTAISGSWIHAMLLDAQAVAGKDSSARLAMLVQAAKAAEAALQKHNLQGHADNMKVLLSAGTRRMHRVAAECSQALEAVVKAKGAVDGRICFCPPPPPSQDYATLDWLQLSEAANAIDKMASQAVKAA
ncbi:hypothetical protein ABPG75_001371 [Micractinium tetrahymenae]